MTTARPPAARARTRPVCEIDVVSGAAVAHFAPFLPPSWRADVEASVRAGTVLVLGASVLGRPVGVALASRPTARAPQATLRWIWVVDAVRRQGVGRALLAALRDNLALEGARTLVASCDGNESATGLLLREGATIFDAHVGRGDRSILGTRWMRRRAMPAGCEAFPWTQRTSAEREAVASRGRRERWFERAVDPFVGESCCEPRACFGLRKAGLVIGWMIVHRVGPNRLHVARLFVCETLRGDRAGLALLTHGLHEIDSIFPNVVVEFRIHADNAKMLRFAKRLEPRLSALEAHRYASLPIG